MNLGVSITLRFSFKNALLDALFARQGTQAYARNGAHSKLIGLETTNINLQDGRSSTFRALSWVTFVQG
jgi:hypothetical protein